MRHETGGYRLARADCRRGIPLADGTVQTVVTSPPYWGLRDYGTAQWEGGDPDCDHAKVVDPVKAVSTSTLDGGKKTTGHLQEGFKSECRRCGAIRQDAQIGLEPTPEGYVARMVELFRDVRRVLRDDGTVFLNLGDSYNSAASNQNGSGFGKILGGNLEMGRDRSIKGNIAGLKSKDLVGIPWRVALALQADGWYLRSDIIWSKPNPMPESVTDRPTRSHEYIFLLSKRASYYYDYEAIREKSFRAGDVPGGNKNVDSSRNDSDRDMTIPVAAYRNKRSVWTVASRPYNGAHFATFPPELIVPCVQAGTSEKGQCPNCGDPWMRMVESVHRGATQSTNGRGDPRMSCPSGKAIGSDTRGMPSRQSSTLGWSSSCLCDPAPPEPQIVLDPFNGAGTAGVVALALGRRYIGLDLSPKYLRMARRRIERPHSAPERPHRAESHPLFCEEG